LFGYEQFSFDSDGLGFGARGDSRIINEQRRANSQPAILVDAYRGSASVPAGSLVKGRRNEDMFSNTKALSWWALSLRFQATYRACVQGLPIDPDSIISISADLKLLPQLLAELSQIQWSTNAAGKVTIDKLGDGQRSPDLADAVCMAFSPTGTAHALEIWTRLGRGW
jgi:phage terminase large subunit